MIEWEDEDDAVDLDPDEHDRPLSSTELADLLPHGTEITLAVSHCPALFVHCICLHDNSGRVHFFPKARCN